MQGHSANKQYFIEYREESVPNDEDLEEPKERQPDFAFNAEQTVFTKHFLAKFIVLNTTYKVQVAQ